jgi:DNA-binding transcriptional LysR family regulator
MRLENLHYFLTVAEESSVGRAAHRLGVTQPALTKGIHRLEQDLGLRLFERSAKGMTLTSAGAAVLERVRPIAFGMDDVMREANDIRVGQAGKLRVGVAPQFAEDLFSPACAALIAQRPGARLEVYTHLNDALFEMLRQGDIDLCIAGLDDTAGAEMEQISLFPDEMCVGLRMEHPILQRSKLRFKDAAAEGWILPGRSVVARRRLEQRVAELGLPPIDVVVEWSASIAHRLNIVRDTNLLTILSRRLLRSPAGKGLSSLPLEQAVWIRQVGIAYRKGAYLSPLAHRLVEILLEQSRKPEVDSHNQSE